MTEPEQDIQRLWIAQPREEHLVPTNDIRSRAERFERRVRRRNIAAAALFLLIIGVEGWQIWREPELLERVGDLLTVAALVFVSYRFGAYVTAPTMSAGLGLTGSVDFYRKQVARQRDLMSHPWRYLALFMPGVGLSLFGRALDRPAAQTVVIAIVGVALFLTAAWVDRLIARGLQQEVDELG